VKLQEATPFLIDTTIFEKPTVGLDDERIVEIPAATLK